VSLHPTTALSDLNPITVASVLSLPYSSLKKAPMPCLSTSIQQLHRGAALISERFPNVKALAVHADVGKEADIKAAVDSAVLEFGRQDIIYGMYSFVVRAMFQRASMTLESAVQQCGYNASRRRSRPQHRGKDLGFDNADQRERRLVGLQVRYYGHAAKSRRRGQGPPRRGLHH